MAAWATPTVSVCTRLPIILLPPWPGIFRRAALSACRQGFEQQQSSLPVALGLVPEVLRHRRGGKEGPEPPRRRSAASDTRHTFLDSYQRSGPPRHARLVQAASETLCEERMECRRDYAYARSRTGPAVRPGVRQHTLMGGRPDRGCA